MLLVPRQLERAGMTGNVPYYGGRLTPGHIQALSHPSAPPPRPAAANPSDALRAVQYLYDTGVITPEEYHRLVARVDH